MHGVLFLRPTGGSRVEALCTTAGNTLIVTISILLGRYVRQVEGENWPSRLNLKRTLPTMQRQGSAIFLRSEIPLQHGTLYRDIPAIQLPLACALFPHHVAVTSHNTWPRPRLFPGAGTRQNRTSTTSSAELTSFHRRADAAAQGKPARKFPRLEMDVNG